MLVQIAFKPIKLPFYPPNNLLRLIFWIVKVKTVVSIHDKYIYQYVVYHYSNHTLSICEDALYVCIIALYSNLTWCMLYKLLHRTNECIFVWFIKLNETTLIIFTITFHYIPFIYEVYQFYLLISYANIIFVCTYTYSISFINFIPLFISLSLSISLYICVT